MIVLAQTLAAAKVRGAAGRDSAEALYLAFLQPRQDGEDAVVAVRDQQVAGGQQTQQ